MKKFINWILKWLRSIPYDKLLHENVSLIICLALIRVMCIWTPISTARIVAVIATFALGILKECFDKWNGSKFDINDVLWDNYGIILALILS